MDRPTFKKGRQYFDTAARPSHVTFDDGRERKRNLPWAHYVEARWDYEEPEAIYVTIGDWLVVLRGHNVAPLYAAIEDHSLMRVSALPEYDGQAGHDDDSFVTEIRFLKAPTPQKKGQRQLDLGV
jgi:hypothetical protein